MARLSLEGGSVASLSMEGGSVARLSLEGGSVARLSLVPRRWLGKIYSILLSCVSPHTQFLLGVTFPSTNA